MLTSLWANLFGKNKKRQIDEIKQSEMYSDTLVSEQLFKEINRISLNDMIHKVWSFDSELIVRTIEIAEKFVINPNDVDAKAKMDNILAKGEVECELFVFQRAGEWLESIEDLIVSSEKLAVNLEDFPDEFIERLKTVEQNSLMKVVQINRKHEKVGHIYLSASIVVKYKPSKESMQKLIDSFIAKSNPGNLDTIAGVYVKENAVWK